MPLLLCGWGTKFDSGGGDWWGEWQSHGSAGGKVVRAEGG